MSYCHVLCFFTCFSMHGNRGSSVGQEARQDILSLLLLANKSSYFMTVKCCLVFEAFIYFLGAVDLTTLPFNVPLTYFIASIIFLLYFFYHSGKLNYYLFVYPWFIIRNEFGCNSRKYN